MSATREERSKAAETSRRFWQRETYPPFPYMVERRQIEADAIRSLTKPAALIWDYGCGDGWLAKALRDRFVLSYDQNVPGKTAEPDVCDLVVCGGVLPYLFHDYQVEALLACFARVAPRLYLRAPCAQDETLVNTYSEALGADYAALYRTPECISELLSDCWEPSEPRRLFPDEIESRFGTTQLVWTASTR